MAALLRFLIQIVLKNQNDANQSEAQREAAKKNLKELLEMHTCSGSVDPLHQWRMSVFGTNGSSGNVLQCKELSRQDKIALLRVGVGKNLLDPETEARLLASEPRLEMELHDPLKASTLTFKFVAVKTPFNTIAVPFPSKVFFTFKFFTFHTVHTETVALKSASGGDSNSDGMLKMGSQYLL